MNENTTRKYEHGVETHRNMNGQLHSPSNNVAARVATNKFGQPLKEYYRFGELHRGEDLPAFEGFLDQAGKNTFVLGWFQKGLAHREGDFPAAIEHNLSDSTVTVSYSKNGILHRDPNLGPACFKYSLASGIPNVIFSSFFENGKQLGGSMRTIHLVPNAITADTDFGDKVFYDVVTKKVQEVVAPTLVESIVLQPAPDLTPVTITVTPPAQEVTKEIPVQEVVVKPKNKGGRPKKVKPV